MLQVGVDFVPGDHALIVCVGPGGNVEIERGTRHGTYSNPHDVMGIGPMDELRRSDYRRQITKGREMAQRPLHQLL